MLKRFGDVEKFLRSSDDVDDEEPIGHAPGLRILAAQLLFATAADLTRDHLARRADVESERADGSRTPPLALVWGPLLVGSMAALAQVAHAVRRSGQTDAATRVLNASTVGLAVAEIATEALTTARHRPSLAPLGLLAAGALAIGLDRHERREAEEFRALRRRASIVERLVPQRKPRIERIVVHV